MSRHFVAAFALAIVSLLAFAPVAEAAAPPLGVWYGQFQDGSGLQISLYGDRTMAYEVGDAKVVGRWTWQPTFSGGILTLHYFNAGYVRAYYSVTYVDGRTMKFSDPHFSLMMRRRF